MDPIYLQTFFGGVTSGTIYALIALGFTLVYRSTTVINFAHGEFVMLGALIAVSAEGTLRLPMAAAVLASILLTALIGIAFQRLLLRPVQDQPAEMMILLTLAASFFLRGSAMIVWGKDPLPLPPFSGSRSLFLWGAAVAPQVLWALGTAILTVLLLSLFLNRTIYGKALRACAENRTAASLMGINVGAMVMLSFLISAAIGALAGVLVTPITSMDFQSGFLLAMKGLTGAIIGGLDRVAGAIAGALILGLIEAYCAAFVSSLFKDAIAFVILIIVLMVRPRGIFGAPSAA